MTRTRNDADSVRVVSRLVSGVVIDQIHQLCGAITGTGLRLKAVHIRSRPAVAMGFRIPADVFCEPFMTRARVA